MTVAPPWEELQLRRHVYLVSCLSFQSTVDTQQQQSIKAFFEMQMVIGMIELDFRLKAHTPQGVQTFRQNNKKQTFIEAGKKRIN